MNEIVTEHLNNACVTPVMDIVSEILENRKLNTVCFVVFESTARYSHQPRGSIEYRPRILVKGDNCRIAQMSCKT